MVRVIANERIAKETGNDIAQVSFSTNVDARTLVNEALTAGNALIRQFALELAHLESHGIIAKGQSKMILDAMEETFTSSFEVGRTENQNYIAWANVSKELLESVPNSDTSMEEDETTRAMNELAAAQADMEAAMSKVSSNVIQMRKFG